MLIDGVSSVPPIESMSPVQQVAGRASEFRLKRSAGDTGEASTMARRRRRKGSQSVDEGASAEVDDIAAEPAAVYTALDTNAFEAEALLDEGGRGVAEEPREYVAIGPNLGAGDTIGSGIALTDPIPEPIIDTLA